MGRKKKKIQTYEKEYPDKVIVKRLLSYLKPYKRDIMLLLFLTVFNSVASLAYPVGMRYILTYIENKDMQMLIVIAGALIGIMTLTFFSSRAYQYNINKL